ncbi:MAG: BatD family protein, partial [Bacteroidetes bacterium]|nr:BatD family protein [Bacteroidota bacterium]
MKRILHITILFLTVLQLAAQDIKFTASAKKVVAAGEQFSLSLTLNAKGSGLKQPAMDDFDILSGPNTSQSSSIQFINGQVSQNVTFTYSYILRATKEGKFTIGEAEITSGGRTYKSEPIIIEVVKGADVSSTQSGNTSGNQTTTQVQGISGEDLFVRV